MAKASSRFVAFSELDKAINLTLEDIGRLCKAGRAYLFQFSADGKTMSNTHEWCAEGVNPQIDNLQDLPVELIPWSIKKLRGGEPIHITDVANLPPEAATEKANLEAQGIKSLLILPLLKKGGDLTGFIGFDNVKDIGRWGDYDLSILHIISGIMLNAFQRKNFERTILVAEDDLFSRKLIQSILHKQGYTVLKAKDGRDNVSRYKTNPSIFLILMDVQMPHLDRLEATRVIRSIENRDKMNRMPIIALTADAMPGDDKKCFEAGCDDYLTKPVDVSLLLATIARYI